MLQGLVLQQFIFGIASFNVQGKILHSFLRLPIRPKNKHDSKGCVFENLTGKLFLKIDEFSVVGQK